MSNVQFQSNTKKHEEDCHVKGGWFDSSLYIFSFTKGTSRDWRKEYSDYLLSKFTGQSIPSQRHKIDTFWGVFSKPKDMDYEEFCRKVDDNEIGMIGNTPIIPTGNNLTKLDNNGNLLVKTINSQLDDYIDCGNMLIDGTTGKVLRNPHPSVIINAPTIHTGNYYLMEIYKTATDNKTGNQQVVSKEYNFLSPDGKVINSEANFTLSEADYSFKKVPRNYYEKDGKNVINDWNIYPFCYIITEGKKIYFFDGPVSLMEDIRSDEHLSNIIDQNSKTFILADLYERKGQLEDIQNKTNRMLNNGKITQKMYDNIMSIISDEFDKYTEFSEHYETDHDRKLAQQLALVAPENNGKY